MHRKNILSDELRRDNWRKRWEVSGENWTEIFRCKICTIAQFSLDTQIFKLFRIFYKILFDSGQLEILSNELETRTEPIQFQKINPI